MKAILIFFTLGLGFMFGVFPLYKAVECFNYSYLAESIALVSIFSFFTFCFLLLVVIIYRADL